MSTKALTTGCCKRRTLGMMVTGTTNTISLVGRADFSI